MRIRFPMAGAVAMVLAGCGVPRDVGSAATRQAAALAAVTTDDAAVRATLVAQADAWNHLSTTVRQKAAFGVTVDADFVTLVDQAAALAARQRQLIEQGADDPAADRAALAQMQKLWANDPPSISGFSFRQLFLNALVPKEAPMNAVDSAIATVQASAKIDAGKKELLTVFLQAAGPAIVGLGEAGLNAVLGVAADGGDLSAAVISNLDARGVAALLALTETQMAALADAHAAQAQAARAAVQTLESAALMAMAQALMGL